MLRKKRDRILALSWLWKVIISAAEIRNKSPSRQAFQRSPAQIAVRFILSTSCFSFLATLCLWEQKCQNHLRGSRFCSLDGLEISHTYGSGSIILKDIQLTSEDSKTWDKVLPHVIHGILLSCCHKFSSKPGKLQ